MRKGDSRGKKGFTIIEVALVLAIGGLIFLMVFIALPGLRASQRDSARREDVSKFLSAVKKYQQNNRGALPGGSDSSSGIVNVQWSDDLKNSTGNNTYWSGFYRDYLGENFMDPDGENYSLTIVKCGANADVQCNDSGSGNPLSNLADLGFPNDYKMIVVLQASCKGEGVVGTSNPRKLAVLYKLEGAGTYCSNM